MDYTTWIKEYLASLGNTSPKGMCGHAVQAMQLDFPELRIVQGFVCTPDGTLLPHWWCLDPLDKVIDPTASQFEATTQYVTKPPSLGPDWTFAGEGRHRTVWSRGHVVIKVPKNGWGLSDNDREYHTFKQYGQKGNPATDIQYARCRLLPNGWLMMERVAPVPFKHHPSWAGWIDDSQVGWNRQGRIVAYDYGF
jgi:hypothetical protein